MIDWDFTCEEGVEEFSLLNDLEGGWMALFDSNADIDVDVNLIKKEGECVIGSTNNSPRVVSSLSPEGNPQSPPSHEDEPPFLSSPSFDDFFECDLFAMDPAFPLQDTSLPETLRLAPLPDASVPIPKREERTTCLGCDEWDEEPGPSSSSPVPFSLKGIQKRHSLSRPASPHPRTSSPLGRPRPRGRPPIYSTPTHRPGPPVRERPTHTQHSPVTSVALNLNHSLKLSSTPPPPSTPPPSPYPLHHSPPIRPRPSNIPPPTSTTPPHQAHTPPSHPHPDLLSYDTPTIDTMMPFGPPEHSVLLDPHAIDKPNDHINYIETDNPFPSKPLSKKTKGMVKVFTMKQVSVSPSGNPAAVSHVSPVAEVPTLIGGPYGTFHAEMTDKVGISHQAATPPPPEWTASGSGNAGLSKSCMVYRQSVRNSGAVERKDRRSLSPQRNKIQTSIQTKYSPKKRSRASTMTKKQLLKSPTSSPCPNCKKDYSTLWRNCEMGPNSAYLCNACGLRFKKGKYCRICYFVYYDADPNPKNWDKCVICLGWTHKACLEQWKEQNQDIFEERGFVCTKCQGTSKQKK
eukprot:TRINITY_DN6064_c0_g1_i2.p1 TRINITY_DN6064_c0_g1~~TRINITY_DN6064_c0_g1_i2.p1  ORF type:complete len:572 (-),score=108.02 TRINITY_DN6064_c0_g1_i2:220-1935(-)